jgi:regulator of PEP synthase PpsR (kinase-PPPase family)
MAKKVQRASPRTFDKVHLLSDSTGNLLRHMMAAFATQFPVGTFAVSSRSFIGSASELDSALKAAADSPGIVFQAFVSPEFKRITFDFCEKNNLPCRDVTGEFVQFLSEHSGIAPGAAPHRLHEMDEEYHRRIQGLEFALEHDDSLGLDTIHKADVVLTGVSRTGKTPTTIQLGQRGILAANVSLARGIDPPPQLLRLPPERIVGLTIDPSRLTEIRTRRQTDLGAALHGYCDIMEVVDEIRWSRDIMRRNGWQTIDVTYQAVEETAARIIEMVERSWPNSTPPSHHH